jgi:hypothetical protein
MVLTNLGQQDKNSQQGALKFRLYLAYMKKANIDNFPKALGVTISSSPLLNGEVFKYLDAKAQSVKPNTEPGESPFNGKLTIPFIIEGISKETLAWVYANQGQDFVVIWERCSDGQRFIAGDPCSGGLKFSYTSIGEQDGGLLGIAGTLTGAECPNPYYFYDGPLPLVDPVLIAADAVTFALTANPFYQLSANTKATTLTGITNVTDSDVGRLIEVCGAGNSNATKIVDNAMFTLSGGIDFVAAAGNKITFQIKKTGSAYNFYEVSRS